MSISTTLTQTAETPIFESSNVSVSYGGVNAVKEVSLQVRAGQIVALIGPNGAGKTSYVDAISGFTPCTGNVLLEGEEMSARPPHSRARAGLARTWQSVELFEDLSVEKNLVAAIGQPTIWSTISEIVGGPRSRPEIDAALSRVGLEWAARKMPDQLTLGQRKLVGVARALVTEPRLLCLDEPAAGLDREESAELGRQLRNLADDGQAMLLIDHDMGLVLGISDYVVVLSFGQVIAADTPQAVVRDPAVLSAYLGSGSEDPGARSTLPTGSVVQ
jgi:branched-chain amino acid transport system ATP-binding protein